MDVNPSNVRFHLTHAMNVQRFHHRDCGLANFAFLSGTVNYSSRKALLKLGKKTSLASLHS